MKRTGSGSGTSKPKSTSTKAAKASPTSSRFVVCVKSGGYVDLQPLKVYMVLSDPQAKADGLVRVVDESGEDYLYPAAYFRAIRAPQKLFQIVERASK